MTIPTFPSAPFSPSTPFWAMPSLLRLSSRFFTTPRTTRKTALIVLASASTMLPYILNVLLGLNLLPSRRDFTPIGFFTTFPLFALSAFRSGRFGLKSMALSTIFSSINDVIIIADARGTIIDFNAAFRRTFSGFPSSLGKPTC